MTAVVITDWQYGALSAGSASPPVCNCPAQKIEWQVATLVEALAEEIGMYLTGKHTFSFNGVVESYVIDAIVGSALAKAGMSGIDAEIVKQISGVVANVSREIYPTVQRLVLSGSASSTRALVQVGLQKALSASLFGLIFANMAAISVELVLTVNALEKVVRDEVSIAKDIVARQRVLSAKLEMEKSLPNDLQNYAEIERILKHQLIIDDQIKHMAARARDLQGNLLTNNTGNQVMMIAMSLQVARAEAQGKSSDIARAEREVFLSESGMFREAEYRRFTSQLDNLLGL